MAGSALVLVALLATGAGTGAGGPGAEPRCAPDVSLRWLLGHWVAEGQNALELAWSEPNHLRRPRRARPTDPKFPLHLDIWAFHGRVEGQLGAERADLRVSPLVSFTIKADGSSARCVLIWREGGATYELWSDGSGESTTRTIKGDILLDRSWAYARFSLIHGPTRRQPFPTSIELTKHRDPFDRGPPLELRRVEGPQHGAAIDQTLRFE